VADAGKYGGFNAAPPSRDHFGPILKQPRRETAPIFFDGANGWQKV
jgi:hypothetical protein